VARHAWGRTPTVPFDLAAGRLVTDLFIHGDPGGTEQGPTPDLTEQSSRLLHQRSGRTQPAPPAPHALDERSDGHTVPGTT
jgi:hypothetical protein